MRDTIIKPGMDGVSDYEVNVGLENNLTISNLAFQMLMLADELEDMLPEMSDKRSKQNPEAMRRMNFLFRRFRVTLRHVYNSTVIKINQNSPTKEDIVLIKTLESYLNAPYGSYPASKLITPAIDYFGMLVHKGIVPIVLSFQERSGMNKFIKG